MGRFYACLGGNDAVARWLCPSGNTYEVSETRVRRATHSSSGERLVVKLPVMDVPNLRTVGRLLHEHQILDKLA